MTDSHTVCHLGSQGFQEMGRSVLPLGMSKMGWLLYTQQVGSGSGEGRQEGGQEGVAR